MQIVCNQVSLCAPVLPFLPSFPRPSFSLDLEKQLLWSVENCVYLAVLVLRLVRHLLVALDKTTLRLLGENTRVRGKDLPSSSVA